MGREQRQRGDGADRDRLGHAHRAGVGHGRRRAHEDGHRQQQGPRLGSRQHREDLAQEGRLQHDHTG